MSNTNKATLSPEDRKTFFRLFLPLLDFTNQKYEISECLIDDLRMGCPDKEDLKEVADVLWANPETIDEYIEAAEKQFLKQKIQRIFFTTTKNTTKNRFGATENAPNLFYTLLKYPL